jgi:chromosome segregation ATPase
MEDHVLNDCPNRDIECEYTSIGCDIKKPQQQLAVHMREAASVHLSLFKTFMQNNLSEKENEIDELKQELRQQREQSDKKLREMQQEIQKIERKQNRAGRYWKLSIIVLIGAISIAYLYPAASPESVAAITETTNSHSSRIEKIDNWIKTELNDTMSSLLCEFEKISHDHNSTKKELRESINSLSSEVERISQSIESLSSVVENIRHDHHLTKKELKQALKNLSSMVEKVNGSQCLIEKRLRESIDKLSSEVERVNQNQQIMEEGLNESSVRVAKFSGLSDNVTQMQNRIHQLQSNADTGKVAFKEISRDVELLKANMDSVEKQIATNSEESKRLIVQTDAINCSLKLTQEFFLGELFTCECVDRGFVGSFFLSLDDASKAKNAEYRARRDRLQNGLATSLKYRTCI